MPTPRRGGYRAADRILRRRRQRDLLTTVLLALGALLSLVLALLLIASFGGLFTAIGEILSAAAGSPNLP